MGLAFEAFECRTSRAGCTTGGGFNLQASAESHLEEVWDEMVPTLQIQAFSSPLWFPRSFGSIPGLSSTAAQQTIMRWRGYIHIAVAGSYDFETRSDDGSLLYINENLVVDNDGNHGMQRAGNTVELTPGYHSISVLYYNHRGGSGLEVSWRPPGATDLQPIPPGETRPVVPGLFLQVYSFTGESLASVERGILAPQWNGRRPLNTLGVFRTPLWWSSRESVLDAVAPTGTASGGIIARWSGRFHFSLSGNYYFRIWSGDGSRLYVNNELVVDNDGRHGMRDRTGTVQLESGWHMLILVFFTSADGEDGGLQVAMQVPESTVFEPLNITNARPQRVSTTGIGEVDTCECRTNLDTIFAAAEDESILTAAAFRSICDWEDTLMNDAMLSYASHCEMSSSGSCCSPQSLPRMLSSAMRIPCSLLTDDHISTALELMKLGSLSLGGVSLDDIADGFINEEWLGSDDVKLATHSRSLLCLDASTFPRVGAKKAGSNEALGATVLVPYDDHLEQQAASTNENEPSRYVFNLHLFHAFFLKQLFRDLYLAAAAFILLFLCLVIHTGSICLATCGMFHILLSVPIAYGIYIQHLKFEVFPYINLIGVFVVAGIGVDDIYVFSDAWKQSFSLLSEESSLAARMQFAWRRSATAMLITSLTTAVAFLVNTVSPIPPIRLFGIWMALLICVDYILVITWYPLVQLVHFRCCQKPRQNRRCCLCRNQRKQTTSSGGSAQAAFSVSPEAPDFDGCIERCFHTRWSNLIYTLRFYIVVALFSASVAAGVVVFQNLTLATQEVQLLRSDHQFSRYLQQVDLFRLSPHRVGRKLDVELYWGVLPADCTEVLCYYVNSNRGELTIDDSFDIADPDAQIWMLNLIEDLRAQEWTDLDRTREHPLENFNRWLQEWGGERMGHPCVPLCNCTRCNTPCELSKLPLARADFYECHEQFLRTGFREQPGLASPGSRNEPGGTWWHRNRSTVPGSIEGSMPIRAPATRIFKWTLGTTHVGSWDYYKMKGFYDSLEAVLEKHRAIRPHTAGFGGFFTHWWFTISDLQANLASSALESMVLATAITLLVLLFATRSLQATVIATAAIAGVLCCTMAVLVFLGWEMGIIESMCLAILIGISCDFVVHLAWAYVSAESVVERLARTPPHVMISQAPGEKELKLVLHTLRTKLGLPRSKLSYDTTKSFTRNRSLLAAEVLFVINSEHGIARAEHKRQSQQVRFARTQFALGTMGISVTSAAATTLVAAIALSQGIIEFFHAFGLFLIFTICFALLFAVVFFAAGAMIFGPTSQPCK